MQRPSRPRETIAERTETALEPAAIRVKRALRILREDYLAPCCVGCTSSILVCTPCRGRLRQLPPSSAYFDFGFYDEDDPVFEDELEQLLDDHDNDNGGGGRLAGVDRRREHVPWYRRLLGRPPPYRPSLADLRGVEQERVRSNSMRSSMTSNSYRSRGDLIEESGEEDARLVSDDFVIALRSKDSASNLKTGTAPTRNKMQVTKEVTSPQGSDAEVL